MGKLHATLSEMFSTLGYELSLKFDLTILTEREHKREPLLEHDRLVPISKIEPNKKIQGTEYSP